MTSSMIYWLTRLDGIIRMCHVLSLLSGAISLFAIAGYVIFKDASRKDEEEARDISLRAMKIVIPFLIFFGSIALFVPTSKEMAAIYLLPKIANNENVKAVPNKSMEILNLKLDEWINDMRKVDKNK